MVAEGVEDAAYAPGVFGPYGADDRGSGRYGAVRYDCSDESVARWINRIANKLGMGRKLRATVQTGNLSC